MLLRSNFDSKRSTLASFSALWVLALAIILSALSVTALRQNNLTMLTKRQAIIDADEAGQSPQQLELLLRDLRSFTHNHMNTQMDSPVQLVNTYNKDNSNHHREILENSVPESSYDEAEQACQVVNSIQRAGCISDYVTKNYDGGNVEVPEDLPVEKYQYIFLSPRWSLDIAGVSIIAAAFVWAWFLYKVISKQIIKYYLKQYN